MESNNLIKRSVDNSNLNSSFALVSKFKSSLVWLFSGKLNQALLISTLSMFNSSYAFDTNLASYQYVKNHSEFWTYIVEIDENIFLDGVLWYDYCKVVNFTWDRSYRVYFLDLLIPWNDKNIVPTWLFFEVDDENKEFINNNVIWNCV